MAPIVEILRLIARNCDASRFDAPVFFRNSSNGFLARKKFASLAVAALLSLGAAAPSVSRAEEPSPELAPMPVAIFPRIRALSLEAARALAMKRSAALSLSALKIAAARADEREVSRRFKVNTTGGLDPFSGQIRFYLALDLERLAGLNKGERESARQKVEQEKIGAQSAREEATRRVSAAWYSLASSQMNVLAAARRGQAARALYVAADARFRAGASELSSALSAMNAAFESDQAYQAARQKIALDCLELAQSCGYMTAEEMEVALSAP